MAYFMSASCPWSRFMERSTSLTELELDGCNFDHSIITKVLSFPKSLKRLTINGVQISDLSQNNSIGFDRYNNKGELLQCLRPVFETLESLELNFSIVGLSFNFTPAIYGMHMFQALHTLTVDFTFVYLTRHEHIVDWGGTLEGYLNEVSGMVDWEVFLKSPPPKLEVLKLKGERHTRYRGVLQFLHSLLSTLDEFFPCLREIIVDAPFILQRDWSSSAEEKNWDMLIKVFGEKDVLLH